MNVHIQAVAQQEVSVNWQHQLQATAGQIWLMQPGTHHAKAADLVKPSITLLPVAAMRTAKSHTCKSLLVLCLWIAALHLRCFRYMRIFCSQMVIHCQLLFRWGHRCDADGNCTLALILHLCGSQGQGSVAQGVGWKMIISWLVLLGNCIRLCRVDSQVQSTRICMHVASGVVYAHSQYLNDVKCQNAPADAHALPISSS